jgi:hypothetical protein
MNGHRPCILGIIVSVLTPVVSFAQDKPTAGLTVTTPTAVGFIWHLSDRVAVRPDFSFSTSEVQRDQDIVESTASSYTLNVSGLFYVREWNDLRAYVSPRFSYSHSSSDLTTVSASGSTISSTNNVYGVGGSFGAEYKLARRFAVFGETGLLFSRQTSTVEPAISTINDRKINMTSVRNALGIVFYF